MRIIIVRCGGELGPLEKLQHEAERHFRKEDVLWYRESERDVQAAIDALCEINETVAVTPKTFRFGSYTVRCQEVALRTVH